MPSRTPCALDARAEIRDRTTEGQHYRMTGLNLLADLTLCSAPAAAAQPGQIGQNNRPSLLQAG